jgi:hypothetical protein
MKITYITLFILASTCCSLAQNIHNIGENYSKNLIKLANQKQSIYKKAEQSRKIIFPNPSTNFFNINSRLKDISEISIFKLNGDKVYQQNKITSYKINHNLSKGAYYVHITRDNKTIIKKLQVIKSGL